MEKFQVLLDLDSIDAHQINISLAAYENRNSIFQAGESQGKSGSFFFFSHDKRFILKTLLKNERKTLLDMLDEYIDHIVQSENRSMLARIYGLYTI
jgi:hypothetical protein